MTRRRRQRHDRRRRGQKPSAFHDVGVSSAPVMRFFAGCGGRDRPVRRPHPAPCETARFPCGGRVGHGCAGSAIARETDVGEDVGGVRGGGGNERAVGATMAERRVAIDGEGASDVADAGGPVRRGVGVGGGAAAGGRHRRPLQVLTGSALCRPRRSTSGRVDLEQGAAPRLPCISARIVSVP